MTFLYKTRKFGFMFNLWWSYKLVSILKPKFCWPSDNKKTPAQDRHGSLPKKWLGILQLVVKQFFSKKVAVPEYTER